MAKHLYRIHRTNAVKQCLSRDDALTLVVTWVIDNYNFSNEGRYIDTYFGDLIYHARERHKNVATVPIVFGTASFRKTLGYMRLSEDPFLVSHTFLKLTDILHAAAVSMFRRTRWTAYPTFGGLDISGFIEEDEHRFFTLRLVYEGSKLVEKQLYRYS